MIEPQDHLSFALGDAVDQALEVVDGPIVSITVDYQPSGEYPYRIIVPDQPLPVVGLARAQSLPDESIDS